MGQKIKLTIKQQVEYMENKGIAFTIVSKQEAEVFLRNNNYFFKVKAYAKNYDKYTRGEKTGKYLNLEFAYLKELSVLDYHIRKTVMSVCFNIEHSIKVLLNSIISEMPQEDGYQIVDDFLQKFQDIKIKISNTKSRYTEDLKHKLLSGSFASWNIVELLTFHDLKNFFEFCVERLQNKISDYSDLSVEDCKCLIQLMFCVRHLRNAAAHNNCLIHNLKKNGAFSINRQLAIVVNKYMQLSDTEKSSKLKTYFLHDFTAMLILLKKVNHSEGVLKHTREDLQVLVNRLNVNKSYFVKNNIVSSSFAYLQKVIDIL